MDHLNDIQKLCTAPDDAEFYAGEIYGMRQWKLRDAWHPEGSPQLLGHSNHRWDVTGSNLATCKVNEREITQRLTVSAGTQEFSVVVQTELERMFDSYPVFTVISVRVFVINTDTVHLFNVYRDQSLDSNKTYGQPGETLIVTLSSIKQMSPHAVTDPSCTCGFYAYTDVSSLSKNSLLTRPSDSLRSSIFGIIKAWGSVSVGPKGFRAEKAKIVGLSVPLTYAHVNPIPLNDNDLKGPWLSYGEAWLPAEPNPQEHTVIPPDFPRYDSYDGMLEAYHRLTEGPHDQRPGSPD